MNYKFPQFNVEITNPTIQVLNVVDNLPSSTCEAQVNLITDTTTFGVTLSGFTYSEDWNDAEVEAWVLTELEKYAV